MIMCEYCEKEAEVVIVFGTGLEMDVCHKHLYKAFEDTTAPVHQLMSIESGDVIVLYNE